jgi:replication factor C small subunit
MAEVLVEKYRPKTVDDFVWASPLLRDKVTEWVAAGETPNLLFTGGAGRGKTTLARMIPLLLGIPSCDVLDVNASIERKVDNITDLITNFTSTWAMGDTGIKYVLLDEADRLTPLSQDALRGEIEKNSENVRFILTGNDRKKFTLPMHSRFQEFEFAALEREEAIMRCANILVAEGIEFEPETLIQYVNAYYPDLRKCLNVLQQRTVGKKLSPFSHISADGAEYMMQLLADLVSGDSLAARKTLAENASADDYIGIFRFLFTNVEVFSGIELQDTVLIAIRDGMWRHSMVGEAEINMAATMVEICRAARKK